MNSYKIKTKQTKQNKIKNSVVVNKALSQIRRKRMDFAAIILRLSR